MVSLTRRTLMSVTTAAAAVRYLFSISSLQIQAVLQKGCNPIRQGRLPVVVCQLNGPFQGPLLMQLTRRLQGLLQFVCPQSQVEQLQQAPVQGNLASNQVLLCLTGVFPGISLHGTQLCSRVTVCHETALMFQSA